MINLVEMQVLKMQFISELHDTYVIKAVKMATHTSEIIRGL